jgi:hypothetical protein
MPMPASTAGVLMAQLRKAYSDMWLVWCSLHSVWVVLGGCYLIARCLCDVIGAMPQFMVRVLHSKMLFDRTLLVQDGRQHAREASMHVLSNPIACLSSCAGLTPTCA